MSLRASSRWRWPSVIGFAVWAVACGKWADDESGPASATSAGAAGLGRQVAGGSARADGDAAGGLAGADSDGSGGLGLGNEAGSGEARGGTSGGMADGGDSGSAGADSSGSAGAPTRESCEHGGLTVTLGSGTPVCDCPAGTWGSQCELTSLQVAIGSGFGCALKSNHAVSCWGAVPGGFSAATGVASVSVGGGRICAVSNNGSGRCWPPIDFEPNQTFSKLVPGIGGACGLLKSGAIRCFASVSSFLAVPPTGTFTDVSFANHHACAVRSDGTVACWAAYDTYGEATPPAGTFSSVIVGQWNTCGLRTDGAITCWGAGDLAPRGVFVSMGGFAGRDEVCGLTPGGTVQCADQTMPGTFSSLSVGEHYDGCGVTPDGQVACWTRSALEPRVYPPPSGVFRSLGQAPYCGIQLDGSIGCWSATPISPDSSPTSLTGPFDALAVSYRGTCGVRSDGSLACGSDLFPQSANAPDGAFQTVVGGSNTFCGIRLGGALSCWGDFTFSAGSSIASPPSGSFRKVAVSKADAAGADPDDYAHACALRSDGAVVCWGDDSWGESSAPLGTFSDVSVARARSCAISSGGDVVCWGYAGQALPPGPYEQLALNDNDLCGLRKNGSVVCTQEAAPNGTFTSIAAGNQSDDRGFTCGLNDRGRVLCWGDFSRPAQD